MAGTREAWLVRSRPAKGDPQDLKREHSPEILEGFLHDAARFPGGHTREACFPGSEAAVAALLAEGRPLLVVGAQSSLTGGATPQGEVLVSTSRFSSMEWMPGAVRCGAGVVLHDLQEAALARGAWFPPVPTYDGATVGGVVSTDAAGAATFKHGTVRSWVDGIVVVLASGEVLELERGRCTAHPEGWFEVEDSRGTRVRVPVPRVARPEVPKVSAGYRGGPALDLVDLFVGSEGTLGIVVSATLRLASPLPPWMALLVPVRDDDEAVALAGQLREEGQRARGGDAGAADVAAIEYMDERSVAILREDGAPARVGVPLAPSVRALLLVQVELPPSYDRSRAVEELAAAHDGDAATGPVASLCRLLQSRGLLDHALPALPGEEDRRRAFFALREAVPEGVNRRVREAARTSGEPVAKAGGDVVVPFAKLGESLRRYRRICADQGLDCVLWGHVSDGNVHPNIIARDGAQMALARAAQLAIGLAAIELGGSPLAEHGTGRNPAKKKLLEALHGAAGVDSMRATRRALDPRGLLAPGVLFDC